MVKKIHVLNEEEEYFWEYFPKSSIIYLQSNLLAKNGFRHAFFTKQTLEECPKKLNNLISKNSTPYFIEQVHGNKVIKASTAISKSLTGFINSCK